MEHEMIITKAVLRKHHKCEKSAKPFRAWCKVEGRGIAGGEECTLQAAKLTGLTEGEKCALARLVLEEKQAARKGRALVKAAATRAKRRGRAKK